MNDADNSSEATHESCCGNTNEGAGESYHCPMAEKFAAALGSPRLKVGLLLPGLLLLVLGILILTKPEVLIWLAGGLSILFGLIFIFVAISLKRLAASMKH